jgi:hypothetical protein
MICQLLVSRQYIYAYIILPENLLLLCHTLFSVLFFLNFEIKCQKDNIQNNIFRYHACLHIPVISATWEALDRRIPDQG